MLLVALFIKVGAFQWLLASVADTVSISCVTRWRPEEIAAGVSDLEIWPLLRDRPHSSLWLRPDLHARYYRVDSLCLVGSANLTGTALGWMSHANLELLVALPAQDAAIMQAFEAEVFRECLQVDQNIFEQVSKLVVLLEPHIRSKPLIIHEALGSLYELDALELPLISANWLPTLRQPTVASPMPRSSIISTATSGYMSAT